MARGVEERGVSNIELFFDLVFVFTLTQLTSLLISGVSVEGALRTALILVVLFWMYGGFVWLTNQVPPDNTPRRLLLIVGMGALLICAMAIPKAFGDRAVAFGLGYLLVVAVHGALYVEAYGAAALRFVPANFLGALFVIAAGFLNRAAGYAAWIVAIVLQFGAQLLTRLVGTDQRSGFDLRPAHFVERHDVLLLIAFGESVVATGIGTAGLVFDAGVAAAALLGLALTAALWWTHFGDEDDRAEHTLRSATFEERVQMAINAYFYAYIVMLFGVIASPPACDSRSSTWPSHWPSSPRCCSAAALRCISPATPRSGRSCGWVRRGTAPSRRCSRSDRSRWASWRPPPWHWRASSSSSWPCLPSRAAVAATYCGPPSSPSPRAVPPPAAREGPVPRRPAPAIR